MRCFHCMKELTDKTEVCPYCGKKPDEENPPHHLKEGTLLQDRYLIGNALGEGGFGITYVGYDQRLELKVAVKEYFPTGVGSRFHTASNEVALNLKTQSSYFANGKDGFLREARSIARFSKENGIVNVRDFFTANNTAYIVMEFLDGVNLNEYLREHGVMSAHQVFEMLLPLMRTLEKMHRENVIHRDISPDNIMCLTDGKVKLMDFGSARQFSEEASQSLSVVLKPGFAPYEQYSRRGKQGAWTDVYALCATIYKCITGKNPPDSLDRVMDDDLKKPSEWGAVISPYLESVLMKGLAVYPKDRLQSVSELIAASEASEDTPPIAVMPSAEKTTMADDVPPAADKRDTNATVSAETPVWGVPQDGRATVAADVPVPPYSQPPAEPPAPKKSKVWIPIVAVIGAALTVLVVLLVILSSRGGSSGGEESSRRVSSRPESSVAEITSTSPAKTTEPTTVAPTTTEPPRTTEEPTTEEPTTEEPTTEEPETEEETESFYETRSYTDDNFSVTVPSYWLHSYENYDGYNVVMFYEPTNNRAVAGMGKLFGIYVFDNAAGYNNFKQGAPRSTLLTTSGGKYYVSYRPTDVQYTSSGESAYRAELPYVEEAIGSFELY